MKNNTDKMIEPKANAAKPNNSPPCAKIVCDNPMTIKMSMRSPKRIGLRLCGCGLAQGGTPCPPCVALYELYGRYP